MNPERNAGVLTDIARMRRRRFVWFMLGAIALLLTIGLAGVLTGPSDLSAAQALRVLMHRAEGVRDVDHRIVWQVRLPRVCVTAAVGALLALSGALMQGLFRNPLASPDIVGTSQGAALGAVIALASGWGSRWIVSIPLCAFVGAMAALIVLLLLANRGGRLDVSTLLLAGMSLGVLIGAAMALVVCLNWQRWESAAQIMAWLMGGVEGRSWAHVQIAVACLAMTLAAGLPLASSLDVMLEGEETAKSLGVAVERVKWTALVIAALATAGAIAVAGVIGFVGLIVPHIVRLALGPAHRTLLPGSAVAGAALLVAADVTARSVHPTQDIYLGVVTAFIGAPFFLFLLRSRRSEAVIA